MFFDVTFITHYDKTEVKIDAFAMLVEKLRESRKYTSRYKFMCATSNHTTYKISKNGTKCKALAQACLYCYSGIPLFAKDLDYFEVEILKSGRGICVGITGYPRAKTREYQDFSCALYNNPNGNADDEIVVKCNSSVNMRSGTVVGVVVNWKLDIIKWYLNGVLIGVGNRKPSSCRVYNMSFLFVGLLNTGESARLCQRYPLDKLRELEPKQCSLQ
jgi:hypothetical protein